MPDYTLRGWCWSRSLGSIGVNFSLLQLYIICGEQLQRCCKHLQARRHCGVRRGTALQARHLAEQVAISVLQVPEHAVQAAPAAEGLARGALFPEAPQLRLACRHAQLHITTRGQIRPPVRAALSTDR
jgi:hypothetical protein